ncbi:unnamed protein product [Orchesella dallaii]|uniref:Uncharacterized protein n=1 Tax=Orchesella dallaii TaxID=48710 RepID=A0ABP1PLS8_9HEXA
MYLGLNITVLNGSFGISGDYELKEGVGLQVSNLGLKLQLGELQMKFPQYFTIVNGENSETEEWKFDIAPEIMRRWSIVDESGLSFEERYEEHVQNVINSYLIATKFAFSRMIMQLEIPGLHIDPWVRNANLTSLKPHFNTTHVEIEFKIPDFQIISEKFILREYKDSSTEETHWRGWSMIVSNYTIRLVANWELKPLVGLQVSNVEMSFGIDDFRTRQENATRIFADGTTVELGATEVQYAERMNADWAEIGVDVTSTAETWLNCFLGGGRNGNSDCDDLLNNEYQIGNFVQLMQTIGLGIAHGQEQLTGNNKDIPEIGNNLPYLFANLSSPTINDVLIEFSTMIIQTWKFVKDFDYIRISENTMYYDFVWENCMMPSECRNIHENMSLNDFSLYGFPDLRVKVEATSDGLYYSMNVPQLQLEIDEFHHETTDLGSGNKEIFERLKLNVSADFGFSGQFEVVDGVGLQLRNVGITFRLRELQLRIPEFYTIENGEESEIQEYHIDMAPKIVELWSSVDENGVTFQRKYEQKVQERINSVLSGRTMF